MAVYTYIFNSTHVNDLSKETFIDFTCLSNWWKTQKSSASLSLSFGKHITFKTSVVIKMQMTLDKWSLIKTYLQKETIQKSCRHVQFNSSGLTMCLPFLPFPISVFKPESFLFSHAVPIHVILKSRSCSHSLFLWLIKKKWNKKDSTWLFLCQELFGIYNSSHFFLHNNPTHTKCVGPLVG